MRFGIDVRYLSHGLMNGIHSQVAYLVPAIIAHAAAEEIFLYADRKQPFELTDLPPNVAVRYLPWRSPLDSVRNDFTITRFAREDRLDVMHFPGNYGVAAPPTATVITLHDALNIFPLWEATRRDWKRPKTVAQTCYLQTLTRRSIPRATMFITVSNDSKQGILARRAMPDWKIACIPPAPAPTFLTAPDPVALIGTRERYDLPAHFVLADAFKNPAVLVRAWEHLPQVLRSEYRILFFSRSADVRPVVRDAVERGIARLIVRPPEEDLATIYKLAEAFIFPSWIEGFGLPILEAMASNTPVIASDRTAIPEVSAGAALLMDAEDDAALARHLQRVLTDPSEADRLRSLGKARAAQFSYTRSAEMTLRVYRAAIARMRVGATGDVVVAHAPESVSRSD